jgi:hypothetical protein
MFKEIKLEQARELSDGVKTATLMSVSGACGAGTSVARGNSPEVQALIDRTFPDRTPAPKTCIMIGCSNSRASGFFNFGTCGIGHSFGR